MFYVLLPQESLLHDVGHSAHSFILVVEVNCPLHNIKELFTHDNNFPIELVPEKCIQTVHVLVV